MLDLTVLFDSFMSVKVVKYSILELLKCFVNLI